MASGDGMFVAHSSCRHSARSPSNMLVILGVLVLALTVNGATQCVSSCKGKANGDYQSCRSCNVYVTCWDGALMDNRPCPGGFIWDDNKKYCDYTSDTCEGSVAGKTPKIGQCVSDCSGIIDGNYQHCTQCDVYVSCKSGNLLDKRPCSPGLLWDDVLKTCAFGSATCEERIDRQARSACLSTCSARADGDYQSCLGCDVYATCAGGALFDNRPCPGGLFWDDNVKRCESSSTTCDTGKVDPKGTVSPGVCVGDCRNMVDGLYQSCETCNGFVQCHSGDLHKKTCPPNLQWNDKVKMCDHSSPTCDLIPVPEDCIRDCPGVKDGFHASCNDCTLYIWCSGGVGFESSCPANSVWDTKSGTCTPTSDLSCSRL